MNAFVSIEVGKQLPFPRDEAREHEGCVFQYDTSGYYMTMYLRGVASREAEALRSEAKFHFALTTIGSAVFIVTRVVLPPKPAVGRFTERIYSEADASYSWHLVPTSLRPMVEDIEALSQRPSGRAIFQVTIVDSLSNIVQAIRFVTPSAKFTASFHEAIARQARETFTKADYQNHVAGISRKYTTKELFRMASVRCVGGEEENSSISMEVEQSADISDNPKVVNRAYRPVVPCTDWTHGGSNTITIIEGDSVRVIDLDTELSLHAQK